MAVLPQWATWSLALNVFLLLVIMYNSGRNSSGRVVLTAPVPSGADEDAINRLANAITEARNRGPTGANCSVPSYGPGKSPLLPGKLVHSLLRDLDYDCEDKIRPILHIQGAVIVEVRKVRVCDPG
jgi:hypothetical protein